MRSTHRFSVIATAFVFSVSLARGQEVPDPSVLVGKIADWPAPATWSPDSVAGGVSTMDAVTSPLPFIGLSPCRIVDTRQAGFPAGYGAPALTAGAPRNFTLTGKCGIPAGAQAVSLNVTVTNTQGPGFILIFPQGAAQPDVSTLNYVAGQTIANAAVVPLGAGGGITVIAGVSGTDLIIDTNGYYAPSGVGTSNTFLGFNAGNFTMTGNSNTGLGEYALSNNTTGPANTATGSNALANNTTGNGNTASGAFALFSNITGNSNTAAGEGALFSNTTGGANTATGNGALFANTGGANTATGFVALSGNTTGGANTATGYGALVSNTTGVGNTASGATALVANTTGGNNIGIGNQAGFNLTTGNNNICIGNLGVAGESSRIRIGTAGTQTATFIAGITGTAVTGVPVLVSGSGQLGVASSSRYVKEDIREIAEESDGLMKLRPVAFRYQPRIDPTGLAQYGLIAEEVADVYPDLVVYDHEGRPETVRYQLVNALLLNEVQKQHRTAVTQEKTIGQQKTEIEALKARLSRLEARPPADSRP